jgi:hypothetical protein
MPKRLCFEHENGAYPVKLIQNGVDRFTVVYGLQVRSELDYAAAASELGGCLMHMLACDGKLDNRERVRR